MYPEALTVHEVGCEHVVKLGCLESHRRCFPGRDMTRWCCRMGWALLVRAPGGPAYTAAAAVAAAAAIGPTSSHPEGQKRERAGAASAGG